MIGAKGPHRRSGNVFSPVPRLGSSLAYPRHGTGLLGAEFLVAVGDVSAFESADRLAAYAGLVPATCDSGRGEWVTAAF